MTKSAQKITLAPAQQIPLNKLVLSQSNVRRIKNGESIEDLAASIARRGLLQSLHVRAVLDADGKETGMYEVPAGGRRYRALEFLVKQKRLNKTSLVPCIVSDARSEIPIEEISLEENIQRAPLHPLDQFRAFAAMSERGMTEEAIAAAFSISVQVVKQRLRLTTVAQSLLDVYGADGMTLEQLMAFTVSDDHARQIQVWEQIRGSWQKEPYTIRRLLTERTVPADDKRVEFIGIDTYEAAGGIVLRDLFEADGGGWLQDVALLDDLVRTKLKTAAEEVAGEGWKWVDAEISHPYGHQFGLRRLAGERIEPSAEERATIVALKAEETKLLEEYGSDIPDEIDERLGEIEAALGELADRPVRYDPADIARAGAFVSIDHEGRLNIQRGYVRPEDEASEEPESTEDAGLASTDGDAVEPEIGAAPAAMPVIQRAVITIGGTPAPAEPEEEDGIRPLPDRLLSELTAYRTLALQDAVANNPEIALTALLFKLVADAFRIAPVQGCLQATVRKTYMPIAPEDLGDGAPARAIAERHEAWAAEIPDDDAALWEWLVALDDASRKALLAHCVSLGINAQYEKPNPYSGHGISEHGLKVRLGQADRLAKVTNLDMAADGWRPTQANYLGRVSKARILEAVREGVGERQADLINHLKKSEMAREAERLLADTGWLPEPLRLDPQEPAALLDADDAEADALPAFLAGDVEDGPETASYGIAAE